MLTMYTGGQCPSRDCKISPSWLGLMEEPVEVILKLKEFVAFNADTAEEGVVWDAMKAFLRGLLIQQVAKIKRRSREWEESIRKEVILLGKQYVEDPNPEKQRRWLIKQQE